MKRKLVCLAVMSILVTGAFVGCGEKNDGAKKSEVAVKAKEGTEEEKKLQGYKEYKNDEGIELLYPEELTEVVSENENGIVLSGIVNRLEEQLTEEEEKAKKELEKKQKEAEEKGEEFERPEEPIRENVPLNLEISWENNFNKIELKNYFENRKYAVGYRKYDRDFAICENGYYVISWEDKANEKICYEKGFVDEEKIVRFTYTYAEDKKENYDEVIGTTEESFKKK